MASDKNAFQCWKFKNNFILKSDKGANITVQCKICLPAVKMLSTSKASMSNLRKHLQVCNLAFLYFIKAYSFCRCCKCTEIKTDTLVSNDTLLVSV